jgi:hypothetical protein
LHEGQEESVAAGKSSYLALPMAIKGNLAARSLMSF